MAKYTRGEFPGFVLSLAIAAVVCVTAAGLSGAWTLELDPDFGGNPDTVECTFRQNGPKLTIACGGGPTISGEVDRARVTFSVPTGRNNELRAMFTGDLDPREITITGTWQLTDDAGKRNGKFTARKH
jgi:hypothetical protein